MFVLCKLTGLSIDFGGGCCHQIPQSAEKRLPPPPHVFVLKTQLHRLSHLSTSDSWCFILQLQREVTTRRVEGIEGNSDHKGVFSTQDVTPRSPRPCTSTPIPGTSTRSHSDSEAMLEEQGAVMRLKGPTENLFLDALSLDPLCCLEVPPPSRLESEKKFPCMEEVTPAPESKLLISPLHLILGSFF